MQLPSGRAGLATRPLLTAGVLAAATALVAACGSAHPTASGAASASAQAVSSSAVTPATSAPATSTAPTAASSPATPATPATSPATPATLAPSATPATPGGTMDQTCAQKASNAFMRVTKVRSAAGGALTITGNPSTLVCGGPDDFHFNVATGTETGHVAADATIDTFPISTMAPQRIQPSQLASYLTTDQDTRIFLIGGPLSAISSLQEQFHP